MEVKRESKMAVNLGLPNQINLVFTYNIQDPAQHFFKLSLQVKKAKLVVFTSAKLQFFKSDSHLIQ